MTGIRLDSFGLLGDVMANPSRHGFGTSSRAAIACHGGTATPDPGAAVYAQPGRHVFWRDQHPTMAFHTLFDTEMPLTGPFAR